jgi:hypothetical protein
VISGRLQEQKKRSGKTRFSNRRKSNHPRGYLQHEESDTANN